MHRPLFLLSKLFLGSLAAIVQLPNGYSLEPSNYNDIQVSSFTSEKNNETNLYEYAIGGQNTGDQYMLLSQTRMTADGVENAPISNDSPFFCREVVKPNDAFNLEYETSGNYEQSQIEMSSIGYGPINESMEFVRNIPQDSYPETKISHDLYGYDFQFEFNKVGVHLNNQETVYFLIVTFDFNETNLCIICDTDVGSEKILNVRIVTNSPIDASKIDIKNVEVIPYFLDDDTGLFGTIGAVLKAFGLFFLSGLFLYILIPLVFIVITVIVLCCVFIKKKKRSN